MIYLFSYNVLAMGPRGLFMMAWITLALLRLFFFFSYFKVSDSLDLPIQLQFWIWLSASNCQKICVREMLDMLWPHWMIKVVLVTISIHFLQFFLITFSSFPPLERFSRILSLWLYNIAWNWKDLPLIYITIPKLFINLWTEIRRVVIPRLSDSQNNIITTKRRENIPSSSLQSHCPSVISMTILFPEKEVYNCPEMSINRKHLRKKGVSLSF